VAPKTFIRDEQGLPRRLRLRLASWLGCQLAKAGLQGQGWAAGLRLGWAAGLGQGWATRLGYKAIIIHTHTIIHNNNNINNNNWVI